MKISRRESSHESRMPLPCLATKEKENWNRKKTSAPWKIYRTRFLIKAQQLTEPLAFVDALGREHRGQPGDYLVESSDGSQRIAPRLIFEDVYVAMGSADGHRSTSLDRDASASPFRRRNSSPPSAMA